MNTKRLQKKPMKKVVIENDNDIFSHKFSQVFICIYQFMSPKCHHFTAIGIIRANSRKIKTPANVVFTRVLAERQGFEPWEAIKLHTISSRAP